jgi:hypothetical protein
VLLLRRDDVGFDIALEEALIAAINDGLCPPGAEVVVVHGIHADALDSTPITYTRVRQRGLVPAGVGRPGPGGRGVGKPGLGVV